MWGGATLILSQAIIYANVFRMYPAFLTGILIHKYWWLIESRAKDITIISISLFLLMFAFLTANFYGPQDFSSLSGLCSTAFHLWYRIIIGSVATLGMICCAFLLDSRIRKNKGLKLLARVGRYTLPIYILQTSFIEIFLATILNFDSVPSALFYFVIAPSICIGVIIISVVIAKAIEKSTITSFLFLGHQYEPTIKRFI